MAKPAPIGHIVPATPYSRTAKRMRRLNAAIKEAQRRDPADPRLAGWIAELKARSAQEPRGSEGVVVRLKLPR